MPHTIAGLNDVVQSRETITFTPNVGGEYGGRYRGPKAKVLDLIPTIIAGGFAIKYECDESPTATLDFSSPTGPNDPTTPPADPNADYTDVFQVFRNTTAKELLMSEHPLMSDMDDTNLAELQKFINDPTLWDNGAGFTAASVDSVYAATYLWKLYLNGKRSVEVQQPVLRVTRTTNPLYDTPFDVSNVDNVMSDASMLSDSGVPANFAVPLIDLASKIRERVEVATVGGVTEIAVRPDQLLLKFGWQKSSITCETVGKSKIQYSVEYLFGLYDTEEFDFV